MRFILDGLPVYFPYEFLYPEQYQYMLELKRTLDARGHCLLEVRQEEGRRQGPSLLLPTSIIRSPSHPPAPSHAPWSLTLPLLFF